MVDPIPPHPPVKTEPDYDPYRMTSIEKLLSLFDGGTFLSRFMNEHADLMCAIVEHAEQYRKGAKGSVTIQINYAVNSKGDLSMSATKTFTPPKSPAASATAYVDDTGEVTLFSPLMKQMQPGVRDATDYDPETGEIRDV